MARVLIFMGHYFPARHVGGPARSVASMVEALTEHEFYIFTSNKDLKSKVPLGGVKADTWVEVGHAKVFYASRSNSGLFGIRRALRQICPDVIYLQSYFARRFTQSYLIMRYLGFLDKTPTILAPRGEFSPGALNIKHLKKRIYLAIADWINLYRGLIWHGCSDQEVKDILGIQGQSSVVVKAPNFPTPPVKNALGNHIRKVEHHAKLIFLSRISPKKNLLVAIKMLSNVRGKIYFDIYGPKEDPAYWSLCENAAQDLPMNIEFRYCGEVDPIAGAELVFTQYDALFLPTLGENYGRVIPESWAAATPVIISDATPWNGLEKLRAGWSIPLSAPNEFSECIEKLACMDEAEHERWRCGAYQVSIALSKDKSINGAYGKLFDAALGCNRTEGGTI